jgi:hypothetical protein
MTIVRAWLYRKIREGRFLEHDRQLRVDLSPSLTVADRASGRRSTTIAPGPSGASATAPLDVAELQALVVHGPHRAAGYGAILS